MKWAELSVRARMEGGNDSGVGCLVSIPTCYWVALPSFLVVAALCKRVEMIDIFLNVITFWYGDLEQLRSIQP